MSALYYVLGAVAKVNVRMRRFLLYFMPGNLFAIVVLIVAGFGMLTNTIEGVRNATTPIEVTVAEIHASTNIAQQYVTVPGLDIPRALFEYGEKDSDGHVTKVEKSWSPLLDRESNRVLLVQRTGKLSGGEA